METKRIKLVVVVSAGVLVIAAGAWLVLSGKLGSDSNGNNKVANIVSGDGVDSDGDGLTDKQEEELGTNIYSVDSDGDSYPDKEELDNGFDPMRVQSTNQVDIDGDGLIGDDEEQYGTDPRLADSDFDGYSDGEEIASGNDPLKANLSDYVSINAVANANKNDSDIVAGAAEGDGAMSDGSIEVSEEDKRQVDYLEDAFSAQDLQTFQNSMVNYVQSQDDVGTAEGEIQLPEISNEDIKIADGASDEQVYNYISTVGDIFYNSFSFQEQQSDLNLVTASGANDSLVYQFKAAVKSSFESMNGLEVPNDEKIIDIHKKIIASLIRSSYLSEQITELSGSTSGGQDDVIKIMNDYTELTYVLKTSVVDNYLASLDQIAEERNLKTKS